MCFFVVVGHSVPSESKIYNYVIPLTSCAVPVFFMISGYLIYSRGLNDERLRRNVYRISKIFLCSWLLYFFLFPLYHNGQIYNPTIGDVARLIFLNEGGVRGHLWYLSAYVYVLVFFMFVIRRRLMDYILHLSVMSLIIYYTVNTIYLYYDIPFNLNMHYFFRNFMFTGIPYFTLGVILSKYEISIKRMRVPTLLLCLIWAVLSEFEINHFGFRSIVYGYSTCPLAISIFLLTMTFSIKNQNIYSKIGERLSLYIYIFHPIVITIVHEIYRHFNLQENIMVVIIVSLLSLGISYMVELITKVVCLDRIKN